MNKACTLFIPLYNEEDVVEKNTRLLATFLKDRNIAGEIILGSNGSTDATPEIISRLSEENAAVKSFHLAERGPGSAFVKGIEMASNEFVASQDADLAVNLDFIPLALDLLD